MRRNHSGFILASRIKSMTWQLGPWCQNLWGFSSRKTNCTVYPSKGWGGDFTLGAKNRRQEMWLPPGNLTEERWLCVCLNSDCLQEVNIIIHISEFIFYYNNMVRAKTFFFRATNTPNTQYAVCTQNAVSPTILLHPSHKPPMLSSSSDLAMHTLQKSPLSAFGAMGMTVVMVTMVAE